MNTQSTPPLGILELGDACALMRARSLDLFEQLGAFATSTDDPALQRVLASACHRHAWHAELWERRSPAIPAVDLEALTTKHRGIDLGDDPVTAYRSLLDELLVELETLEWRVDPDLDPSTTRVISLVRADLTDLRAGLG